MFDPPGPVAPDATPGARIHWLRITRNMTQKDLAAGQYSVSYMSAIERGRVRPTRGVLKWCAQRLGVSLGALLGEGDGAGDEAEARQAAAKLAYEQVHAQMLLTSGELAQGRAELSAVRRDMGTTVPRSLIWLAAYAACLDGDIGAALRDAEAFLGDVSDERNDHERAVAHWLFGMIHARRGDTAQAVAEYQRALELEGRAYFDPDAAMLVRGDLSRILLAVGNLPAAASLTTEALRQYVDFADPATRTRRAREHAEQAAEAGHWLKAYQLIRWAWEGQREVLAQREAARSYLRGALLAAGDDSAAPEHELRQALALADQSRDEETLLLASSMLALTLAERGEQDAVRQILDASRLSDERKEMLIQPAAQGARLAAEGWVAHAAGDSGEARQHAAAAEAALVAAASDEVWLFVAAVYLALSRLYEGLEETEAALRALRRAVALSRGTAQRGM